MRSNFRLAPVLLALFLALPLFGQQETPEPPSQLVRETVQNEIQSNNGGAKFMFKDNKQTPRGSQLKLIVESTQGAAGMLLAMNGKPLTSVERQAEEARLDALAHNPAELKKKQKADRDDTEHTIRIMKALPDAFLYQRDGTEPGSEGIGNPGDELVRLKFRPNPNYYPPTHTEQVLAGMRGYLLIDANRHRIAKIDGTLFKDVEFGWGILGRLDKGGRFEVEQGVVKENDWEVTCMNLSFTGKELLIKKLVIASKESFSDFQPAPPNLTFAQAVEFLKKQKPELAENQPQRGTN